MREALGAERRAVFEEITRALGDDMAPGSMAWWQYLSVIAELGHDAARELVDDVHAVEAAGGMTTKDGSRRRTPGGVFFALAYERFGPKRAKSVRARADRRFQEEMLRRFLKLIALIVPANAEQAAASTEDAAPTPAHERAVEAPAAKAKTLAPERATKPAQRREPARSAEPEAVEVVVVHRRQAAGAAPAARPGPSTPDAGG